MSRDNYFGIWSWMANKMKINSMGISTSRRNTPLWEQVEQIFNEIHRSISIVDREGRILIALDDDKLHLNLTTAMSADLFNMKYTTHVKANRKGIVGHTAVSTGANIPLQISFKKTNDSNVSCFKNCLSGLFGQAGDANLKCQCSF